MIPRITPCVALMRPSNAPDKKSGKSIAIRNGDSDLVDEDQLFLSLSTIYELIKMVLHACVDIDTMLYYETEGHRPYY